MPKIEIKAPKKSFKTKDGVTLSYLDLGSGEPMILIPGWSQTKEQFCFQIEAFAKQYRVLAIDSRGHGESSKPEGGYKVSRLATDLYEFITGLNLNQVTLLGHSMGCSVIFSYFEQYLGERVKSLVLVDQGAFLAKNPLFSEQEVTDFCAIFDSETIFNLVNGLKSPDAEALTVNLCQSMFTDQVAKEDFDWVIQQNLKLPRDKAADLLFNHWGQDWRQVASEIKVPCLLFGGEKSLFPKGCMEWLHNQIKGSKLEIFSESEGGSHMLFFENPSKFNALVLDYLSQKLKKAS